MLVFGSISFLAGQRETEELIPFVIVFVLAYAMYLFKSEK